MNKLGTEILELLKNKYNQIRPYVVYNHDYPFYTDVLEDNLVEKMSAKVFGAYNSGSGNELNEKMKALHSSSAMTYNLLGNGKFVCLGDKRIGEGTYSVAFEKQLYTLNPSLKGKPANLDAFLTQEDTGEVVACEMKMTEWILNKPSKLKSAYLIQNNYQYQDTANVFIAVARSLMRLNNTGITQAEYECMTTTYDAFQMFKHMLACYNGCRTGEIKADKLTLINVVWELTNINNLSEKAKVTYNQKIKNEHQEFAIFYAQMQPIKDLFKAIGVDFEICYYSVASYMSIATWNGKNRQYLTRYEI